MNNVTGSLAADFNACYNGVAGVIVRDSSGVSLFNVTSNSNRQSGLWLDSTNESSVSTATTGSNGSYGVWLARSSHNVIADYGSTENGDTGTFIGCGPLHCTGNETSDNNRLTNGGNTANAIAGVMIEHKSGDNIITATGNSGNQGDFDMVDENSHCGTNTWYNNIGTASLNCIH
jgi:hypothetical protein